MTFIPIESKSKSYKHSLFIYWTALVYQSNTLSAFALVILSPRDVPCSLRGFAVDEITINLQLPIYEGKSRFFI